MMMCLVIFLVFDRSSVFAICLLAKYMYIYEENSDKGKYKIESTSMWSFITNRFFLLPGLYYRKVLRKEAL